VVSSNRRGFKTLYISLCDYLPPSLATLTLVLFHWSGFLARFLGLFCGPWAKAGAGGTPYTAGIGAAAAEAGGAMARMRDL